MVNTLGTLLIDVKADTQQLVQGFNRAEQAVNKTTKQMSYAVKGLIGTFLGLNTLDIASNFTKQLDIITSSNNKLKLVTKTTDEFTTAQRKLFEVSQITSSGYSETVDLYSKLSVSMSAMGKSQVDILRTVETVNKAIAISGSTANEAKYAILQLGQAFGSGKLQGDELKSISENAQGLARAIAEGMGVAVGDLKQLGADGKITSEILAKAIERVASSVDDSYSKMTKTIAQANQMVSNSITHLIGDFDKMTGISNVIADNIIGISKALDSINSDDLESMFNTFKLGAETIIGTYIALKLLKGGQEAYNFVSNASTEINQRNIDIENAKNKAYNDGITASYARKAADEAMANAQQNTVNISQRNIDIENAKAQAYSDGTRAVMARKLADEAMANAQSSGLVMLEKHAKELDIEATALEKVAKKQLDYSYAIEAKAVKPPDMKYAKQLEAEAIQLEKTAKKQLEYSYSLEATANRFSLASIGARTLSMAMSTIPLVAITTGLELIIEKLISASKESTLFKESLTKTTDELKKLSEAQLEVRIIGGIEELKNAEKELATLKKQLDNLPKNLDRASFAVGGNNVANVEETNKKLSEQRSIVQSNIDTTQEQISKSKDLLDLLDKIKGGKKNYVNINTILPKKDSETIDFLINGDEVINKKLNLKVETTPLLNPLSTELRKIIEPDKIIYEDTAKYIDELTTSGRLNAETVTSVTKDMEKKLENIGKDEVEAKKKAEAEKKRIDEESYKRNKATLEIQRIGEDEYQAGLIANTEKLNEWAKAGASANDIEIARIKLQDELNKKVTNESNKEDLSLYEKKVQLLDDSASKEKELQGIQYAGTVMDIENSNKTIKEKDRLIAKQTELYNATIDNITYKDNMQFEKTISDLQDSMLQSQLSINDALFNFNDGLDGTASKIAVVAKKMGAMDSLNITNKQEAKKLDEAYIENFVKYADDIPKTKELAIQYEKDDALLKEKNLQSQLVGYASIASAMSATFKTGSKEAATFQLAENALTLTAGVRAILSAGSGDPYTSFARMAMMAVTVKSLLGNIGVALGMGGNTTTSDAFSSQTANTGTGSSLGDSKKASASITNALSTLKDFAQPQYQTLVSMNNYLQTIANNISGVSSILVQNATTALGQNYTSGYNTPYKNNIGTNNTLGALGAGAGGLAVAGMTGGFGALGALSVAGPAGLALLGIDKLLLGGAITNLIGGVFNTALGGIFGETSQSRELTDSGINFADSYLKDAVNQLNGSIYQTISTTTTKKSWFSKSTNTSIATYFSGLDNQVSNQFSLVLSGLYNIVAESGKALGLSSSQLNSQLDNFVVSIGKISLKDKTGSQIQELLTNIFAQIGDNLISTVIPNLTGFQKVGEGLFDTLTRVATGIQEALFYSDRLGLSITNYSDIINKQGTVGFEALAQSIIKADEATYGWNNGVVKMIDSMDLTASQLYTTYLSFSNIRDILVATSQSASNLSSSMVTGAGSISALESGTKSYMENFLTENQRLNVELSRLNEQFSLAGYAMPKTRQEFINLINSIDTSTESGAKAYGKLITISDDYNKTISTIEDNLKSLVDMFKNLGDSVSQTIVTLAGANTDSQSATQQIQSFWEKRKEIDNLLALNGNLTSTQQSKLSTLVGEVNSLATNIQGKSGVGSNITNELISNLSGLRDNLNLESQILSVNIVGVASNVSLLNNLAGSNTAIPSISTITSNYVTSDILSTDIKDILTTIKDNISNYPKKTLDMLDNVINGNQRVKVQN